MFSLEMGNQQLAMRLLCAEARVNMHFVRTGKLPSKLWKNLGIAAGEMEKAPIYLDDTPAITVRELRAKARRLVAEKKISMIVVDYLQLMQGLSGDNRQQEIAEISRNLKNLARELKVPIIALSQLERSMARRTFEESGDYVIDTFDVKVREHLNDGFNNGVYSLNETSADGNLANEGKLAIEVSPGKAYVKGYRTEFIAPQYVDVDKPRDFDMSNNSIVNFNLGNFVKVYDVFGWPEISGDGVTDGYQTLDLYDTWTLNSTNDEPGGGNRIGRCRCIQLQAASTAASNASQAGTAASAGVYDMWFFDAQMFTAVNINNAVHSAVASVPGIAAGRRIQGKTSGAFGYVADTGNQTHYIQLEHVSGKFTIGEILEHDGLNVGTLEATKDTPVTGVIAVLTNPTLVFLFSSHQG